MKYKNTFLILTTIILLFLIGLLTFPPSLIDPTDVKDFSDTAKFFAGEYKAKLRTAHSILYGLLLSPYIKLTNSFILIKMASAFWLSLLILSIYYISNKNKKTLYLILACPLIWYMSPWLSPIHPVSLLFLWAYYFIKKFDSEGKSKHLFYSGLLIGLAAALWETAFYFSFIFLLAFLYNKKLYHSVSFIIAVFIGMLPNLVINQLIFNFPFYSLAKHAFAALAFALYGGAYNQGYSSGFIDIFMILLFTPFYIYIIYTKEHFKEYKKELIFVTLSILFILTNPQIRLLLLIIPIIILILGEKLTQKQLKIQFIIFVVLSIIAISPYIIQTKFELSGTKGASFEEIIGDIPKISFNPIFTDNIIKADLDKIAEDYPNEIFLVGPENDRYKHLAHLYWGNKIKEFVSIEDYNLFLQNKTAIVSKRISSNAPQEFRREIWIEVGLGKNSNDKTDYENIQYTISLNNNLDLSGFRLIKCYEKLCIFKRTND